MLAYYALLGIILFGVWMLSVSIVNRELLKVKALTEGRHVPGIHPFSDGRVTRWVVTKKPLVLIVLILSPVILLTIGALMVTAFCVALIVVAVAEFTESSAQRLQRNKLQ